MHAYRYALAVLALALALLACLALVAPAQAQLPAGTYPGYIIIKPDGTQEIKAAVIETVTLRQLTIEIAGSGAAFGMVTGAGYYQDGATVTITGTAGPNTTFDGVSGDPGCSTSFVITADMRCIATFTTTPAITLTVVHTGTGTGTTTPVPGTTTRSAGETISTSASAAGGSTFAGVTPAPCDVPSFVMPSTSLTCSFAFNTTPVSFTLTLNTVGSGTAAGGGAYLPGIQVTLQAVANAGQVFTGWSGPAPCPQNDANPTSLTMPTANLTCTATFQALPPPTGAGTWQLLNTGTMSDPQPSSGGFQPWAYHPTTGDLWFYSPARAGQVYRLPFSTLRWTMTPNSIVAGVSHNCGLALVPDNNALYMGLCAPNAGQPGSWIISTATGTLGQMTYLENDRFGRGSDALCDFDRVAKVIYCLGGWANDTALVEKAVVPFTGLNNWVSKAGAAGTKPVLGIGDGGQQYDVFTRTTYNRGGWSVDLGKLWVTDMAQDFFTYDRAAGANGTWTRKAMTGTKPPSSAMVAYHGASGTLVAVAACIDDGVSCKGGGQTYLGNVTTGVWSLGPGPAQGPTKNQFWATNIAYNEARQTINYISHNGGVPFVWEFTPSTTPPDPPATFTFTVAKTGSGDGTVGGGGTYPSGTVVVATASPNSASEFKGWVEAGCPSFPLTSNATCTARLDLKTTVPIGPYPDLPNLPRKTLVPVPCGPKTTSGAAIFDQSPWPCGGGSKHQRWAADGLGNVWTGFGDTSPSNHAGNPSQNQGYRLRVSDGQWTRWNPACRGAGFIQPSFPDEVVWAWDERGYFWLLGGVTQGTDGATCNSGGGESGATLYKTGLFKYTPATDLWERFTGVNGTNGLWGTFDNRDKNLLFMGSGGSGACGSALFKLNVDTRVVTSFNACFSANPFPGSGGGNFEDFADVRVTSQYAWDRVSRRIYIIGYHNIKVASETSGQKVLHLWSINVDTGAILRHADPPNGPDTGAFRNPDAQDIVFDTVNRRVLFPYTRTHCGAIEGMYSWNPDTNTWESHSITPVPNVPGGYARGNTATYDPVNNVMIVGGSVACADWGFPGLPNIDTWYLWRY